MYQDQLVYVHVEVVSLGHYVKVLFIYVNVLHVLVATILSSFYIICKFNAAITTTYRLR